MPRITSADAQGWAEGTKLSVSTLDLHLLDQIETETITRLSSAYNTTGWTDDTNTPKLVKVAIAKTYVAWVYDRQYSENQQQGNDYAAMLRTNAEMIITGLIDGTITLTDATPIGSAGGAAFYPNDASSALEATPDDPSLGPAKFSMGKVF